MSFIKYFTFEECETDDYDFYKNFPAIDDYTIPVEKNWLDCDKEVKRYSTITLAILNDIVAKLNNPDPKVPTDFLQFHYDQYVKDHGTGGHFLTFLRENIWQFGLSDQRAQTVNHWIEAKINELKPAAAMNPDTGNTPPNQPRNKTYITHPQQILLFHELGIIKFLKDKYKLGNEKTAEIISYLANRGKDNTGDYIRYIDQPKDSMAKSKRNVNPKTPANIEFVKQIMNQINLPV